MGQKNNPNGFRHTGLDINPVANYKMLFQKRLIQKKYIEGVYRNYTLGNVLEKGKDTWVVEYSKLPKKTSAIDKENVLKLKNLTIIERKLADNENATVIANSLKNSMETLYNILKMHLLCYLNNQLLYQYIRYHMMDQLVAHLQLYKEILYLNYLQSILLIQALFQRLCVQLIKHVYY